MGRRYTIGYISLDFVKNGLNGVTKMLPILTRTAGNPLPPPIQPEE